MLCRQCWVLMGCSVRYLQKTFRSRVRILDHVYLFCLFFALNCSLFLCPCFFSWFFFGKILDVSPLCRPPLGCNEICLTWLAPSSHIFVFLAARWPLGKTCCEWYFASCIKEFCTTSALRALLAFHRKTSFCSEKETAAVLASSKSTSIFVCFAACWGIAGKKNEVPKEHCDERLGRVGAPVSFALWDLLGMVFLGTEAKPYPCREVLDICRLVRICTCLRFLISFCVPCPFTGASMNSKHLSAGIIIDVMSFLVSG